MHRFVVSIVVAALFAAVASGGSSIRAQSVAPLVIGDTFTVESKALGETRRINVYPPPGYAESSDVRLPVLYMPDGGVAEDFLHIAGLVQISVLNGTMRPFLLVGIENTARRRDMTGPTQNAEDKKIAPVVGGSAAFRTFLRDELKPVVNARYRTTGESAIVGESLAGLFVTETFLLEPELFDTYIAIDPSLWWNDSKLVAGAAERLRSRPALAKTLWLASSGQKEISSLSQRLAGIVRSSGAKNLQCQYANLPGETHGTVYHPAALRAFRELFKPPPSSKQ